MITFESFKEIVFVLKERINELEDYKNNNYAHDEIGDPIETDIDYHEANGEIDGLTMALNLLQQYENI